MSLRPPVKDDVVRVVGHHETERGGPREVIRQDSFYGTRKIVTHIRGGPHGWDLEADVMGQLDGRGYIRNDLIFGLNCMCLRCSASLWIRPSNKTFSIEPNPIPCQKLGDGPPAGVAYDCGRLSVVEKMTCGACGYVFRITDGVCHDA